MTEKIEFLIIEAVSKLRQETGPFDLIFCDIGKEGYPGSLPVITEKLRSGDVLITDNLLWSGRIFNDSDKSTATENIREFSKMIFDDDRWISSIVPSRDGLLVAYKK